MSYVFCHTCNKCVKLVSGYDFSKGNIFALECGHPYSDQKEHNNFNECFKSHKVAASNKTGKTNRQKLLNFISEHLSFNPNDATELSYEFYDLCLEVVNFPFQGNMEKVTLYLTTNKQLGELLLKLKIKINRNISNIFNSLLIGKINFNNTDFYYLIEKQEEHYIKIRDIYKKIHDIIKKDNNKIYSLIRGIYRLANTLRKNNLYHTQINNKTLYINKNSLDNDIWDFKLGECIYPHFNTGPKKFYNTNQGNLSIYQSPDFLVLGEIDKKTDLYSLAKLIYQMIFLADNYQLKQLYKSKVLKDTYLDPFNSMDQYLKDYLNKLLIGLLLPPADNGDSYYDLPEIKKFVSKRKLPDIKQFISFKFKFNGRVFYKPKNLAEAFYVSQLKALDVNYDYLIHYLNISEEEEVAALMQNKISELNTNIPAQNIIKFIFFTYYFKQINNLKEIKIVNFDLFNKTEWKNLINLFYISHSLSLENKLLIESIKKGYILYYFEALKNVLAYNATLKNNIENIKNEIDNFYEDFILKTIKPLLTDETLSRQYEFNLLQEPPDIKSISIISDNNRIRHSAKNNSYLIFKGLPISLDVIFEYPKKYASHFEYEIIVYQKQEKKLNIKKKIEPNVAVYLSKNLTQNPLKIIVITYSPFGSKETKTLWLSVTDIEDKLSKTKLQLPEINFYFPNISISLPSLKPNSIPTIKYPALKTPSLELHPYHPIKKPGKIYPHQTRMFYGNWLKFLFQYFIVLSSNFRRNINESKK